MLIDFCFPVKNEEDILELNASRFYEYLKSLQANYDWRIVIIVNGSSDNTLAIAQDLELKYRPYIKYKHIQASGKSLALKQYFEESDADILAFSDIDLAVSLDHIPDLIQPLINKEAQLVAGSRLMAGSNTSRSPLREFSSRNYNHLSRLLFKNELTDLQCGFKAFPKNLYRELAPYFYDDKWFFDAELMIFAKHFGYTVKELPVDWRENRYRDRISKVKKREALVFVKKLFQLKKRLKRMVKNGDIKKARF